MNDRDRILQALMFAGEHGLTDFELADVLSQTGRHIYPTSAGTRRNELVKAGLVAHRLVLDLSTYDDPKLIHDYRPGPTARRCQVWVLAEYSEPVKL